MSVRFSMMASVAVKNNEQRLLYRFRRCKS